jgi:hypothetical protein
MIKASSFSSDNDARVVLSRKASNGTAERMDAGNAAVVESSSPPLKSAGTNHLKFNESLKASVRKELTDSTLQSTQLQSQVSSLFNTNDFYSSSFLTSTASAVPPLHPDERISAHVKYFQSSPLSIDGLLNDGLGNVLFRYKQHVIEKQMHHVTTVEEEEEEIMGEEQDEVAGGEDEAGEVDSTLQHSHRRRRKRKGKKRFGEDEEPEALLGSMRSLVEVKGEGEEVRDEVEIQLGETQAESNTVDSVRGVVGGPVQLPVFPIQGSRPVSHSAQPLSGQRRHSGLALPLVERRARSDVYRENVVNTVVDVPSDKEAVRLNLTPAEGESPQAVPQRDSGGPEVSERAALPTQDAKQREYIERLVQSLAPLKAAMDKHNLKEELHSLFADNAVQVQHFHNLLGYLYTARDIALEKDADRDEQLTEMFTEKYKLTGLPMFPHRMLVDDALMAANDLIPFSSVSSAGNNASHHVQKPVNFSDSYLSSDSEYFSWATDREMREHENHVQQVTQMFYQKRTDNGVPHLWVRPDALIKDVLRGDAALNEDQSEDLHLLKRLRNTKHSSATHRAKLTNSFTVAPLANLPRTQNRIDPLWDHEHENALRRLQERVDFPKNPRFRQPPRVLTPLHKTNYYLRSGASLANFNLKKAPHPTTTELGLVTIPSKVVFSDYQPGQTYVTSVLIKNMTTLSHRFRVVGGHSPYFSIQLVKTPVNANGLVAPGMSCTYNVTFIPDSLANFYTWFTVETEMGGRFNFDIAAIRTPPALGIPDVLDCGVVRDNSTVIRQWTFTNTGGDTRVQIQAPADNRPVTASIWDSLPYENPSQVHIGTFELFPSCFNVPHGETFTLFVRYRSPPSPPDANAGWEYRDIINYKMACDNGDVHDLQVQALVQKPFISVLVEKSQVQDEAPDWCNGVLDFGVDNPQVTTQRCLFLRNETKLKLPYEWVCYDVLSGGHHIAGYKSAKSWESMSILPSKGWLPPLSEGLFYINLDRRDGRTYDVAARFEVLLETAIDADVPLREIAQSQAEKDTTPDADHVELSHEPDQHVAPIIIGCVAHSEPYKLTVFPPFIRLPTRLEMGEVHSTTLTLTNDSHSPLYFEWILEGYNNRMASVYVSPTSGFIPAKDTTHVSVTFEALAPGKLVGTLSCYVSERRVLGHVLPFSLQINVDRHALVFERTMLHFGILRVGDMKDEHVTIRNSGRLPVDWDLSTLYRCTTTFAYKPFTPVTFQEHAPQTPPSSSVVPLVGCIPCEGTLVPGDSVDVRVIFYADCCQHFEGLLELSVVHRAVQSDTEYVEKHTAQVLDMRAQVHEPHLSLTPLALMLDAYPNHPARALITLKNKTVLPTVFEWKEIVEDAYTVTFQPTSGVMAGRQVCDIECFFTAHALLSDPLSVNLHCMVDCNPHNSIKAELHVSVYGLQLVLKHTNLEVISNDDGTVASTPSSPTMMLSTAPSTKLGAVTAYSSTTITTAIVSSIRDVPSTLAPPENDVLFNSWPSSGPTSDNRSSRVGLLLDEPLTSYCLNFGSVLVYSTRTLFVHIDNESDISAHLHCHVEHTPAHTVSLPPPEQSTMGFKSLPGQSYVGIMRKKRYLQQLVPTGAPAAFTVSPSHVLLDKRDTLKIYVHAHCVGLGQVRDTLVINANGKVWKEIPIQLNVVDQSGETF